jgi:hypothetical protein
MDDAELASCLRSWRDRLDPAEVGLPAGTARRAPGLRREELAQLAGVSVDYLARLEQGRASHPSQPVVASLARALRLDDAERDHLFRVAGHAPPTVGQIRTHMTPGVQRILDRLGDVPVTVMDAGWNVVAMNPLATALLVDPNGPPVDRNVARRTFYGQPNRVRHTSEQHEAFEVEIVADLHEAIGRYPNDAALRELVEELNAASPRFAELWSAHAIAPRIAESKIVAHPTIGEIRVDCDILLVRDSDLRLVVYSAAPGSPDATALQLLATLGMQRFAGDTADAS